MYIYIYIYLYIYIYMYVYIYIVTFQELSGTFRVCMLLCVRLTVLVGWSANLPRRAAVPYIQW